MAEGDGAGVPNHVSMLPAHLRSEKRALLRRMAQIGARGLEGLEDGHDEFVEDRQDARQDTWDRAAAIHAPRAGVQEIMDERRRLLGGFDSARGMLGTQHSQELDRIAAANIAYLDQLSAASKIHKQNLDAQIAALLGTGGGGGGGGGGSGGYGGGSSAAAPLIDTSVGEGREHRLDAIFKAGALDAAEQGFNEEAIMGVMAQALQRNADLVLQLDRKIPKDLSKEEMEQWIFQSAQNQGASFMDALGIAQALTQAHGGASMSAGTVYDTVGGIDAIRDVLPGMEAVFGLAGIDRNEDRAGWFTDLLTAQQQRGAESVLQQAAQEAARLQAAQQGAAPPPTSSNPFSGVSAAIAAAVAEAERKRQQQAQSAGVAALSAFR